MAVSPSEVGAAAEREVAHALSRAGFHIYVPVFAPHSRIDLIAVRDDTLLRVQVKSARIVRDAVTFHACSNTGNVPKDYRGEIDAFGVYSPDLDSCYLVPIEHVPTRAGALRVAPPRNNQAQRIRWASDYLIRPSGE